MANSNETIKSATSSTRPRQVLLVGLGGVGSRTVDKVLSMMPEGYKPYTKAIAVDTDLEELDKLLKYIPTENRIALGSNPENGQSVTVGEYIRNHPETTEWFVKGEHLDLIKSRNTAQGAKQIRMVSRIALSATNDFLGMKKKLEDILQDLNRADGTTLSRGLLVMVICSVAGGTGAGTVLQFPLYLEQALAKTFSDEDVQIECSMLLPNVFSRAQDIENQEAARANAYAVVRELMAMNSGRLKRGDLLPDCDFEEKSEHISPYGRIMFFDDVSMSGDSIESDLDRVYVPKTAAAINEYLFGPVHGKIASALDNTLARVYRTGGASIFSSVGTAKLAFPRATYVQYITGQWITKAISTTWLHPDRKVAGRYRDEYRNAVQNDTRRPNENDMRRMFCETIDAETTPFYRQIKSAYFEQNDTGMKKDMAEQFWEECRKYLHSRVANDKLVKSHSNQLDEDFNVDDTSIYIETLEKIEAAAKAVAPYGSQYAIEVMQPIEAENPAFFTDDNDEKHLFTFLKNKKLHPIMIRYFLYKLYNLAEATAAKPVGEGINTENFGGLKKASDRADQAETERTEVLSRGKRRIMYNFATRIKFDLEKYIEEIEGMFKNLEDVVRIFGEKTDTCLNGLVASNPKTGTILAGGRLSMMYTWKRIESLISEGEDAYTIDPNLNNKIHEIVYRGFVKQAGGADDAILADGTKLKIRTKYDKIMLRELQMYYSVLIKDHYSMCLPSTVIDAALLECGLRNAFADEKSRADDPDKYSEELFIKRGVRPQNYATDADEDKPGNAVSNATYLNALLSQAIGNSKPYCGRIDDNATEKGIMNRLMVANQRLLRTTEDTYDVDEYGVAKQVYIEDEIIEGVSTSRIRETNINTKFVTEGISVDEIKIITTLAGLQPFNFVSFLPPDDDEHAPTKAKSYYIAYRELINNISVKNDCITPHLHRDWHLADRLDDLTETYTNTYNKDAARAFVYGFIFNVIRVLPGGVVEIGDERTSPYFTRIFGERGLKRFMLLDETTHAKIDSMDSTDRKSAVNTILVKVFELLATSQELRDVLCGYATDKFSQYTVEKSSQYLRDCKEDETTAGEELYTCILDVINGYYQGTRRSNYKEEDRADKNVKYMFITVLEELFNMCKLFSDDLAKRKALYLKAVDSLYDDGYSEETADVTASAAVEEVDEFEAMLAELVAEAEDKGNPFVNGSYRRSVAKDMVEVFLKK